MREGKKEGKKAQREGEGKENKDWKTRDKMLPVTVCR